MTLLSDVEKLTRDFDRLAEQSAAEAKATRADLSALSEAFEKFVAVQQALATKAVSTRTFIMGVLALMVPVIVLIITLVVTGK